MWKKILIPGMKEVQMLWSSEKRKKKKRKIKERQIRTSVPQLYPSLTTHPPVSGF